MASSFLMTNEEEGHLLARSNTDSINEMLALMIVHIPLSRNKMVTFSVSAKSRIAPFFEYTVVYQLLYRLVSAMKIMLLLSKMRGGGWPSPSHMDSTSTYHKILYLLS